jgi:hypothetical protein
MKHFINKFRLILEVFARTIIWHLRKILDAIHKVPDAKEKQPELTLGTG